MEHYKYALNKIMPSTYPQLARKTMTKTRREEPKKERNVEKRLAQGQIPAEAKKSVYYNNPAFKMAITPRQSAQRSQCTRDNACIASLHYHVLHCPH